MKPSVSSSLKDIFYATVKKTSGCWLWLGSLDVEGYGRLRFHRKSVKAHRVAYELEHGPIKDNLLVCHDCDNPQCVRPAHLFLGTTLDNSEDSWKKGRQTLDHLRKFRHKGEDNGRSKITREQAEEIRKKYKDEKITQQRLAYLYGLNQTTVSAIIRRLIWQ